MKSRIVLIFLISIISVIALNGQAKSKINTTGTWKFAAPTASEGYSSGVIIIGSDNKKDTATMLFTGNDYRIPCENLKTKNDSVLFSIYLQDQNIKVMLKIENDTTMSGKALYSEGEVPLTLTRAKSKQ